VLVSQAEMHSVIAVSQDLSLLAERGDDRSTGSGMECRHYLSVQRWFRSSIYAAASCGTWRRSSLCARHVAYEEVKVLRGPWWAEPQGEARVSVARRNLKEAEAPSREPTNRNRIQGRRGAPRCRGRAGGVKSGTPAATQAMSNSWC